VVSRGRNRIRDLQAPAYHTFGSQLAHAELNALLELRCRPEEIHGYTIYTSVEPCPLCLGAIYMSGVRNIAYACPDAYAGSTNLLGKTWYLARKPVKVSGPQGGSLAEFACALHIDFCLRQSTVPTLVVEMERQAFPAGVALAEKLRAGNVLAQLAAGGAPVALVFDQLSEIT
jgi:tRNA(adenine34) deaminase